MLKILINVMAPKKETVELPEKKVGYSATAKGTTLDAIKDKAHDHRIPFTQLVESLMEYYLETGKGYTPPKK